MISSALNIFFHMLSAGIIGLWSALWIVGNGIHVDYEITALNILLTDLFIKKAKKKS